MTQLGQLGNGGLTASSLIFILLTVGGAVVALLRWFAIRVLSQIENHAVHASPNWNRNCPMRPRTKTFQKCMNP